MVLVVSIIAYVQMVEELILLIDLIANPGNHYFWQPHLKSEVPMKFHFQPITYNVAVRISKLK